MANFGNNIPENCDKILFAEDVVSFIIHQKLRTTYYPTVANPYREFIYEGFNNDVKDAVNAIYLKIIAYNTIFRQPDSSIDRKKFKRYARHLQYKYFNEGFDPKLFLFYCVHLSITAAKLATFTGLQEAGNLAVNYILEGFGNYDLFTGGWDILKIVAKSYADAFLNEFSDALTPDSEFLYSEGDDDSSSVSDDSDSEENDTEEEELEETPLKSNNHESTMGKFDESKSDITHTKDSLVVDEQLGSGSSQNVSSLIEVVQTFNSVGKKDEVARSTGVNGTSFKRQIKEHKETTKNFPDSRSASASLVMSVEENTKSLKDDRSPAVSERRLRNLYDLWLPSSANSNISLQINASPVKRSLMSRELTPEFGKPAKSLFQTNLTIDGKCEKRSDQPKKLRPSVAKTSENELLDPSRYSSSNCTTCLDMNASPGKYVLAKESREKWEFFHQTSSSTDGNLESLPFQHSKERLKELRGRNLPGSNSSSPNDTTFFDGKASFFNYVLVPASESIKSLNKEVYDSVSKRQFLETKLNTTEISDPGKPSTSKRKITFDDATPMKLVPGASEKIGNLYTKRDQFLFQGNA